MTRLVAGRFLHLTKNVSGNMLPNLAGQWTIICGNVKACGLCCVRFGACRKEAHCQVQCASLLRHNGCAVLQPETSRDSYEPPQGDQEGFLAGLRFENRDKLAELPSGLLGEQSE